MADDAIHDEVRDGDIVTFKQFSQENHAWSQASLRWLRFNESTNGLAEAGAFIQIGTKRVLIYKPRFFAWVRSGQKRSA
jgi:hypothetical protein